MEARGKTPERAEFENSVAELSEEEEPEEMEDDMWSDDASESESSESSTLSESNASNEFASALGEAEVLRLAERWQSLHREYAANEESDRLESEGSERASEEYATATQSDEETEEEEGASVPRQRRSHTRSGASDERSRSFSNAAAISSATETSSTSGSSSKSSSDSSEEEDDEAATSEEEAPPVPAIVLQGSPLNSPKLKRRPEPIGAERGADMEALVTAERVSASRHHRTRPSLPYQRRPSDRAAALRRTRTEPDVLTVASSSKRSSVEHPSPSRAANRSHVVTAAPAAVRPSSLPIRRTSTEAGAPDGKPRAPVRPPTLVARNAAYRTPLQIKRQGQGLAGSASPGSPVRSPTSPSVTSPTRGFMDRVTEKQRLLTSPVSSLSRLDPVPARVLGAAAAARVRANPPAAVRSSRPVRKPPLPAAAVVRRRPAAAAVPATSTPAVKFAPTSDVEDTGDQEQELRDAPSLHQSSGSDLSDSEAAKDPVKFSRSQSNTPETGAHEAYGEGASSPDASPIRRRPSFSRGDSCDRPTPRRTHTPRSDSDSHRSESPRHDDCSNDPATDAATPRRQRPRSRSASLDSSPRERWRSPSAEASGDVPDDSSDISPSPARRAMGEESPDEYDRDQSLSVPRYSPHHRKQNSGHQELERVNLCLSEDEEMIVNSSDSETRDPISDADLRSESEQNSNRRQRKSETVASGEVAVGHHAGASSIISGKSMEASPESVITGRSSLQDPLDPNMGSRQSLSPGSQASSVRNTEQQMSENRQGSDVDDYRLPPPAGSAAVYITTGADGASDGGISDTTCDFDALLSGADVTELERGFDDICNRSSSEESEDEIYRGAAPAHQERSGSTAIRRKYTDSMGRSVSRSISADKRKSDSGEPSKRENPSPDHKPVSPRLNHWQGAGHSIGTGKEALPTEPLDDPGASSLVYRRVSSLESAPDMLPKPNDNMQKPTDTSCLRQQNSPTQGESHSGKDNVSETSTHPIPVSTPEGVTPDEQQGGPSGALEEDEKDPEVGQKMQIADADEQEMNVTSGVVKEAETQLSRVTANPEDVCSVVEAAVPPVASASSGEIPAIPVSQQTAVKTLAGGTPPESPTTDPRSSVDLHSAKAVSPAKSSKQESSIGKSFSAFLATLFGSPTPSRAASKTSPSSSATATTTASSFPDTCASISATSPQASIIPNPSASALPAPREGAEQTWAPSTEQFPSPAAEEASPLVSETAEAESAPGEQAGEPPLRRTVTAPALPRAVLSRQPLPLTTWPQETPQPGEASLVRDLVLSRVRKSPEKQLKKRATAPALDTTPDQQGILTSRPSTETSAVPVSRSSFLHATSLPVLPSIEPPPLPASQPPPLPTSPPPPSPEATSAEILSSSEVLADSSLTSTATPPTSEQAVSKPHALGVRFSPPAAEAEKEQPAKTRRASVSGATGRTNPAPAASWSFTLPKKTKLKDKTKTASSPRKSTDTAERAAVGAEPLPSPDREETPPPLPQKTRLSRLSRLQGSARALFSPPRRPPRSGRQRGVPADQSETPPAEVAGEHAAEAAGDPTPEDPETPAVTEQVEEPPAAAVEQTEEETETQPNAGLGDQAREDSDAAKGEVTETLTEVTEAEAVEARSGVAETEQTTTLADTNVADLTPGSPETSEVNQASKSSRETPNMKKKRERRRSSILQAISEIFRSSDKLKVKSPDKEKMAGETISSQTGGEATPSNNSGIAAPLFEQNEHDLGEGQIKKENKTTTPERKISKSSSKKEKKQRSSEKKRSGAELAGRAATIPEQDPQAAAAELELTPTTAAPKPQSMRARLSMRFRKTPRDKHLRLDPSESLPLAQERTDTAQPSAGSDSASPDKDSGLQGQLSEPESTEGTLARKSCSTRHRNAEMRRQHRAQELQRQLDEMEVRYQELEARGVQLEKAIRGQEAADVTDEAGAPLDDAALMAAWFALVNERGALLRREQQLHLQRRQLQLEERHDRLQRELRQRMAQPDAEKAPAQIERERELVSALLEVSDQRRRLRDSLATQQPPPGGEREVEVAASELPVQEVGDAAG